MPTNNYAERWSPELLEIQQQETLCSPFITTNVQWLDARTFHFTQMSTTGFKNHNRKGGWNKGEYLQTDVPFTCKHDRDVEFLVDTADVDETNATASIENVAKTFQKTKASPETDALFFSKTAQKALSLDGYHSETALSSYTKANVFSKLKKMIAAGKLRRYRAKGALIVYVVSDIMDLLEQSPDFTRKIEVTTIADGGTGIETRITEIDGVPIIEVIDDEVFYDKFSFEGEDGGFEPIAKVAASDEAEAVKGSRKLNVFIASPLTTKVVPKTESIYYFAPGTHTEGDGYLYQHRSLSDVFTFPNGKDNKIDSIYVDVDTKEYDGTDAA
ncbi:MAG: hypothetical protein NC213_10280 [Acetobacter sp.]|nr:hypothetical protein [Bacteroides sp.]MCM1342121.1 hypothetical protein [Acetobacter sp.]MCM1434340.1 phage capsid protein [Clostridiales bacterium]